MRTLLVSLNAKYEHENPAPWCLKAAADARAGLCGEVDVLSLTINDEEGRIFASVAQAGPDVAALSCSIWNRDLLLHLCADLRTAFPSIRIIVGGPEVSHADGADEFLAVGADWVLAGEGEERFPDLLEMLASGRLPEDAAVAGWRTPAPPLPPERLFSPCMPAYLARLRGRIAYVESSRGCPYRCSYCLSSESTGMTWIPHARVFAELALLVGAGAKVIKFTDRTFNLSEAHTLAIWSHLEQYRGQGVTFHFEVAPDRLSEAQIAALAGMPAGLVQIEAGIQSVHPETLHRIDRVMHVPHALAALARVAEPGNVHVHADLIAGLPGEGFDAFAASFDLLETAGPHHLQLGFLKLLRGTRVWREANQWGYLQRSRAPYEMLGSDALSVGEVLRLKDIEETVERYRNSGRFLLTLQWLSARIASPFRLYALLAERQRREGLLGRAVASDALFRCMQGFLAEPPAGFGSENRGSGLVAGKIAERSDVGLVPVEASWRAKCWDVGEAHALLRLDWVCAHRNPFLPDWLNPGGSQCVPETNEVHAAYGDLDGNEASLRKTIRNRLHAAEVGMPQEIRYGVRFVAATKSTDVRDALAAKGVCEGDKHAYPGGEEIGAAPMKRILIDTRAVHPVYGRPEVVILPDSLRQDPQSVVPIATCEAGSVE